MADRPIAPPYVEKLRPYVPDEPLDELRRRLGLDDILKLSSNESLLGPSPKAAEAIRQAADDVFFYPDGAGGGAMRRAIAEYHDLPRECVLTANGSNEAITLLVRTFCEPGVHSAATFDYGFIIYALVCRSHGVEVRTAPMGWDYGFDLDGLADTVDESTKLVFVANPNNPTGTWVGEDGLRTFLEALPERVIAVVDEAYVDFVQDDDYASALTMTDAHHQLVVLRSFSKAFGMAGLRAGYAIAPPQLVDHMHRLREPFTCNAMAQAAVPPALDDRDWLHRVVTVNEAGRAALETALADLSELGVHWTPSQTNFLLVETPRDAREVADAMLRRGVLVRPMTGYGLDRSLRIALADSEKMARCVDALGEVVENPRRSNKPVH